jgi:sec-independent protein translocase protein TatA
MFGFGLGEILPILIILLLLFGAKRLPSLARGIGDGIREFRSSLQGIVGDPVEKPQETTLAAETKTPV